MAKARQTPPAKWGGEEQTKSENGVAANIRGGKKNFCNLLPWVKMVVISPSTVQLDYPVIHLPEAYVKWTNFFYPMILEAGWARRKSGRSVLCKIL